MSDRWSPRKRFRVAPAILVAILFSGLAACMTNPATGERRFNLMSMDQEIQMGREADRQISQTMGLYPDEALQTYVSDIGLAMGAGSEWPDLPWTFRVIDDETVNAFALPGGHIYVTRGILAQFNSEAQLAGAGMQLLFLSFSRADENESDKLPISWGCGTWRAWATIPRP